MKSIIIPIILSLLVGSVSAERTEVQEPKPQEVEYAYPTIVFHYPGEEVLYDLPTQYPVDSLVLRPGISDHFHKAGCKYLENRTDISIMTREDAISFGLEPCDLCKP